MLGSTKAESEQHEITRPNLLRAGNHRERCSILALLAPVNADRLQRFDVAVFVADELTCLNREFARVVREGFVRNFFVVELCRCFFVAVVHSEDLPPFGPRVVGSSFQRRLRNDFKRDQALAAMSQRRADAVGSGITTTDHDHVFIFGTDVVAIGMLRVQQALGVLSEELHRHVDAAQIAARGLGEEVIGLRRSDTQDDRIEVAHELLRRQCFADLCACNEFYTFGDEQVDSTLHNFLLVELHVGDAVHEQSTNAVSSFVNGHVVTCRIELSGAGQARWARANHGDLLAGSRLWWIGSDPVMLPTMIDDRALDVLDRDWRLMNAAAASAFAWSWANSASELREVVRQMQAIQGFSPTSAIDEVIPFGDQVVDRATRSHALQKTTGMAKRNTTIHAARALLLESFFRHVFVELVPVQQTDEWLAIRRNFPSHRHETPRVSHRYLTFSIVIRVLLKSYG